ncbi:MAG: hypothetical protein Kow0062_15760 [Acidobacteriota bacterium]
MSSRTKGRRPAPSPAPAASRREPFAWLAGGVVLGLLVGVIGTTAVLRPEALGLSSPGAPQAAAAPAVSAEQALAARVERLRERLAANPRDAGALLELGEVFAQAGRLDQAAAHVERALEVAPDDAEVHVRAARLLRSLHRPEEALAAARRAMELDRQALAPALAAFDAALHGAGDMAAAREALDEARRRAPDDAAVARAGAELERIEGLIARAEADPRDYDTLVQLGNYWYDTHRWEQAADAYGRALAIRGDDANVITDYGTSLFNAGRHDEALAQFERALFVDPQHWQAAYNGIVVSLNRGDTTAARLWLDRLRQIRPDHPEIPRFAAQLGGGAG